MSAVLSMVTLLPRGLKSAKGLRIYSPNVTFSTTTQNGRTVREVRNLTPRATDLKLEKIRREMLSPEKPKPAKMGHVGREGGLAPFLCRSY